MELDNLEHLQDLLGLCEFRKFTQDLVSRMVFAMLTSFAEPHFLQFQEAHVT